MRCQWEPRRNSLRNRQIPVTDCAATPPAWAAARDGYCRLRMFGGPFPDGICFPPKNVWLHRPDMVASGHSTAADRDGQSSGVQAARRPVSNAVPDYRVQCRHILDRSDKDRFRWEAKQLEGGRKEDCRQLIRDFPYRGPRCAYLLYTCGKLPCRISGID